MRLVFHGRIINRHLLAIGDELGVAAFHPVKHLVLDTHVGKGAAHHHLMVTTAGAVAVEVGLHHVMLGEVLRCRRSFADVTGRRDMVGGDRVTQNGENVSAHDILERIRARRFLHALEIGRVGDVGGAVVPAIGLTLGNRNVLPFFFTAEHIGVFGHEHFARYHAMHRIGHFLIGRPDVFQIDGLAVLTGADGIFRDVDLHRTGKGVGHHQHRAGQVVRPHQRMHAAFEVAVARQHRRHHQVMILDGLFDIVVQRAGVTDTGRTAITHQVETQLVERLVEP